MAQYGLEAFGSSLYMGVSRLVWWNFPLIP